MSQNTELLKSLHDLYQSGIITKDDFEEQKSRLLAPPEPPDVKMQPQNISETGDTQDINYKSENYILYGITIMMSILVFFIVYSTSVPVAKQFSGSYESSYLYSRGSESESNSYSRGEKISLQAYRDGYRDGSYAYGLSASETATADESYMAQGYNYSSADVQVYKSGYYDGMMGRPQKY